MSLLSRVLLKSAYVCANDAGASSGIYIRDYQMNVIEFALDSAEQTVNSSNLQQDFEVLKFASRRATSFEVASNEGRFDIGREIARIKNPSFPIIRHELASGPAHPLINVFLIERLICFFDSKRD